jgi:hypothetical protein
VTAKVAHVTDRRSPSSKPAAILAARIAETGTDVTSIEKATGIPSDTLQAYLNGASDLPVVDLVKAGGLLSLSPSDLLGAA